MEKVNVNEKLTLFNDHWNPRIIGELNGQHVKIAKLKGEFVWHSHVDEDELFMVLKGELIIEFKDRKVVLKENEFLIVPRGTEHRPVAHEEVSVLLFEPTTTLNTGDNFGEMTRDKLDKI